MNESAYSTPFRPIPFAPMTFGQILDRTYRLMRTNLRLLVGIAAVPSAVLILIVLSMEAVIWIPMIRQFPKPLPPDVMFRYMTPAIFIPSFTVLTMLIIAVFSLYMAAASYAATRLDLGVKATAREAYGLAWRRTGRHLWLLVLCYVYAALPAILIEIVLLIGAGMHARGASNAGPEVLFLVFGAFLVFIAAVVYGILMALRLSLAFPACVEERLTAGAAIKRSFQLTRGAKGRIFLVVLVVNAILYAVLLVAELVAMFLVAMGVFIAMAAHPHPVAPWSYIGLGGLGICGFGAIFLFTALTWAALTTSLAVLYHDQRLRKDGLLPAPAQAGEPV
ncbi:MAG TPA: hypothetical protein VGE83_12410 [Terracidiphilus sp.]